MSRQPLPTSPMSLYRFRGGLPLRDYVTRCAGVTVEHDGPLTINGARAHLLAGTRVVAAPAWSAQVTGLSGVPLPLTRSAPFAIVLVQLGDWVVAATWGGGRHLLDDVRMDEDFGLLFGIRRLDPTRLRAVGSSLLDVSARTVQTSYPSGSTVPGFRLDPAGELVTHLSGMADMTGTTYHRATGGRQYRVRAGSSLGIQVGHSPKAFLSDLETICRVIDQSDENSPLRFLSRVRPLRADDVRLPLLELRLAEALGGDAPHSRLAMCWPAAAAAHVEATNSFRVEDRGVPRPLDLGADLDVDAVTTRFTRVPVFARVNELKRVRVVPCSDEHGEEPLTRPISLDRWLVFETGIGDRTMCLHQGRWYEIGQDAVQLVRDRVAELVSNKSGLSFPVWVPTGKQDDEHRYCALVAEQPGYLCLDRDFGRTPMHPRFEFADVLGPNDELVHVKWLGRATAASHLFTQARVSVWAQRLEPDAVRQLDAKVNRLDTGRRVPERPRTVVLAAAGRRWTVDELFTLSQVELLRLNEDLHQHGVELRFADIPFVPKAKA
ncbi:TIGR04141 family sporadically distributed protein [Saccharothrix lopnurensis]|uniref:TIGR04141 family sporadically distributed protein n=1 Tax=Saccharothrix lopnurensis TaxID=1670621 RepID=A0ABW1P443_9PSEU